MPRWTRTRTIATRGPNAGPIAPPLTGPNVPAGPNAPGGPNVPDPVVTIDPVPPNLMNVPSMMPKGAKLSPAGDIGMYRQMEAGKVGRGFKNGGDIVRSKFKAAGNLNEIR